MLEVEGLRKAYGDVVALDGVDLGVAAGEICALLGPNGAGKTTLVSIVAGLRHANAGSVTVNGVDALHHSDRARQFIGLAPQDLAIYPTLAVRDNLAFFGELAGLWGRRLDRRIDEVSEALELTPLLSRQGHTLSGGEKRRLHTAMAILHRPPLLLLDEPTTGVDVQTRNRVLDSVRHLADEDGCAVCYSTHYLHEVEALEASVAIIDHGHIIARGQVGDLVARHGRTAVELVFEGEPPAIDLDRRVEQFDTTVRVFTDTPAADAATILTRLGRDAERLRALEIVSSSLESVFLTLTGRRYASGDEPDEGPDRDDVEGHGDGPGRDDVVAS